MAWVVQFRVDDGNGSEAKRIGTQLVARLNLDGYQ